MLIPHKPHTAADSKRARPVGMFRRTQSASPAAPAAFISQTEERVQRGTSSFASATNSTKHSYKVTNAVSMIGKEMMVKVRLGVQPGTNKRANHMRLEEDNQESCSSARRRPPHIQALENSKGVRIPRSRAVSSQVSDERRRRHIFLLHFAIKRPNDSRCMNAGPQALRKGASTSYRTLQRSIQRHSSGSEHYSAHRLWNLGPISGFERRRGARIPSGGL